MAVKSSRRLVIDTDVYTAASDRDEIKPRADMCAEFLDAVLEFGHRAVISDVLLDELDRHGSKFATTWLASMERRGRLVDSLPRLHEATFVRLIDSSQLSNAKKAFARKDAHLIDAARQTDSIVVSMDETVRGIFGELVSLDSLLKRIAWVNAERAADEPIRWLRDGAKREAHIRLGGKRRV